MSNLMIILAALFGILILIAGCLAALNVRNEGYVSDDSNNPRWIKALYAKTRPYACTRVLVNFVFWAAIFGILFGISRFHFRSDLLTVQGSSPLSPEKFLEYADGELWLLQLWSGVFVLTLIAVCISLLKLTGFGIKRFERVKGFILDDLWGAILNFGSMFMVSGWIQVFTGNIRFLWMLLFSALNIITYMLFSNLGGENEEKKD